MWIHKNKDEPIELYSELDEDRYETKKVEILIDDTAGYAEEKQSNGETLLGKCPIPSLEDINSNPEFKAKSITKEEFFAIWNKYVPFQNKAKRLLHTLFDYLNVLRKNIDRLIERQSYLRFI